MPRGFGLAPVGGGGLVGRGVQVVAKGRAQRRFEPGRDLDLVDQRLVGAIPAGLDQPGERRHLGLDATDSLLTVDQSPAGFLDFVATGDTSCRPRLFQNA